MRYCITGLPRSRTAWFAAYFTACGSLCAHEGMSGCDSMIDYFKKMETFEGNSDSGIVMYPHDCPTVIIERDIFEVKESVKDFTSNTQVIDIFKDKLDEMQGLRVSFEDIDDRLEEITHYCEVPYKSEIAAMFKNMTITSKTTTVDNKTLNLMEDLLCLHG